MSADGISFSQLHSGLICMENKGVDTFCGRHILFKSMPSFFVRKMGEIG